MAAMTTFAENTVDLMKRSATVPEVLHEVMLAAADEIDRKGLNSQVSAELREHAKDVVPLFGVAADQAWGELPWLEKFKLRRQKAEWKQAFTESMCVVGRRYAVREIAEAN